MDYAEACAFVWGMAGGQTNRLRSPEHFDLRRMRTVLERLGDPQAHMLLAHVAGSKGKGSTCAMLAGIMRRSGRRTGLYSSPHLHTVRERIRIDGVPLSHAAFAAAVSAVAAAMQGIGGVSPFEALTAAAFWAFREAGVETAAVEVGLGGRLDATNVINPYVSVITSISFEHTEVLGNTLAQIAAEKAGIIKTGVPVLTAAQDDEAAATIARRATDMGCTLQSVGREWRCSALEPGEAGQSFTLTGPARPRPLADGCYSLPLLGEHQVENAALALAAAELGAEALCLDHDSLRQGLAAVAWPGRLEVLSHHPLVIVDGAHNVDSMGKLLAALRRHFAFGPGAETAGRGGPAWPPAEGDHIGSPLQRRFIGGGSPSGAWGTLRLVFGASADKDTAGMLRVAASGARLYACSSSHGRSMAAADVLAQGVAAGMAGAAFADGGEALWQAVADAGADDCVCVAGSLFVVAAAREAWARRYGVVEENYGEVEVISLGDAWRIQFD
ncbi:MAG: bifunctional folylpolyglutamate synthase/dihydrofolate synthase [Anaerolineae bacterium]